MLSLNRAPRASKLVPSRVVTPTLFVALLFACRTAPSEPMAEPAVVVADVDSPEVQAPAEVQEPTEVPGPAEDPSQVWEPPPDGPPAAATDLDSLLDPPPPPAPEHWPASLSWPVEGLGRPDSSDSSARGGVHVVWRGVEGDSARMVSDLVSALGDADACDLPAEEGRIRCRGKTGGRRWAVADELGEGELSVNLWVLPRGHKPPGRLPGRCVVPPERSWRIALESSSPETLDNALVHEIGTHRAWDLDGDGEAEVLVPQEASPSACSDEVAYDVYVMRGTCGHRVGSIVGAAFDVNTARFHHGLRELTTERRAGRGKQRSSWRYEKRTYRFNGKRLRASLDVTEETCHHCKSLSCHAGR